MTRNRMPRFDRIEQEQRSSRDTIEAWIIIIAVLCVTVVGCILDRAALMTP